ncbi:diguanylate cyclase [Clostridium sardiniense]|uniref:Diguanylate cyclase n=1 Tax=Clostridium sardiniense TaxID=29369 RepID=A0ABS7KUA6_CLOSR|nr:diguanylate cyclase [Clostridium sardiniense]MBY0754309.1 diguanylate cyclase [Clostridium sardiniense]MDQ0461041.1 diguanylate cyclase (GGDEF)-like protein [Clostridium sardiniense]
MSDIESNKYKQINDIVAIVKLASLLFTGMILLQCFFKENKFRETIYTEYSVIGAGFLTFLLLFIYILWSFSTSYKMINRRLNVIQIFETVIFILIFTLAIVISGANTSEYKIIFLFIITTTTIQSGMKHGIVVSIISSIIILAMDLLCMPGSNVNVYFENDLVLSAIFMLTAWPLGFYVKIEREHIDNLKSLANEDGLTGVYNHRYFHETLTNEIDKAKNENSKVSMIFIDIDYFKQYNDLYGHQEGDKVLRKIGDMLKEATRESDIVARYGGEEFSIILPNTDENEATDIAEHIRSNIESTYFEGQENQPNGNLTVSIGISVFPDKVKSDVELVKSADDALYRAKFFNKNRVESYTSVLDELKDDIDESEGELVTSIKALISVINAKDRYTYGHSERVVFYSRLLGERLGLNEEDMRTLVYGAYMHDIGKINISKDILIKKMTLTNEEWSMLKEHPQSGVEIIKPVKSLRNVAPIILHHHEKYNGTGYPCGLKGEEIPYLARILTVVDCFDAMTSNRPYNKRKTYLQGIEEITAFSGIQFDPEIAKVFIEIIKENEADLDRLS